MELNTPQPKILIVDDDSSVSTVLRITLAPLGFEAKGTSTGKQALALLGTDHYDVVLLDINMAGMDGIETWKEIQRLSPRSAVLMLTVRDSDEDKAKAFEAGAKDYITKPFRLLDLVERIQAALREPSSEVIPN